MRTSYYLAMFFLYLAGSCTVLDNQQEKKYMGNFLAGKDSCRNNYLQTGNGIYIRVVDNLPALDSHYHVYCFRNGKINHYLNVLGTDQTVDSLLNKIKKLEARNQRDIMNQGVYYCNGDTVFARNFYRDTHGVTIKHLIEDSRLVIKQNVLTVVSRKKMTGKYEIPVHEEYYFVKF
ncbi:MAG: hypothetical protein JNM68_07830 [Dinghuibacter sp.]|nr:hypothetical protein [Dinghuibacter sp.]